MRVSRQSLPAIPVDAETGWSPLQWRLAQTKGGNKVCSMQTLPFLRVRVTDEAWFGDLFSRFAAAINAINLIASFSSPPPDQVKDAMVYVVNDERLFHGWCCTVTGRIRSDGGAL